MSVKYPFLTTKSASLRNLELRPSVHIRNRLIVLNKS